MKYRVNSVKIEEFIKTSNECIKALNEEIRMMYDLLDDLTWEGIARDTLNNKYNDIVGKIDKMNYSLTLYIKFMKVVLKNYGEGNEQIKKDFQKEEKTLAYNEMTVDNNKVVFPDFLLVEKFMNNVDFRHALKWAAYYDIPIYVLED